MKECHNILNYFIMDSYSQNDVILYLKFPKIPVVLTSKFVPHKEDSIERLVNSDIDLGLSFNVAIDLILGFLVIGNAVRIHWKVMNR